MRCGGGRLRAGTAALPLLALAAVFQCYGCGQDQDRPSPQALPQPSAAGSPRTLSSHDRMLALLRETAVLTLGDHPILGDKLARELRPRVARARFDGSSSPAAEQAIKLYSLLGKEELRLGNIDQAIEHLSAAYRGRKLSDREGRASPQEVAEAAYSLGIAYMRLGETRNCCVRNSPESCLLPIRGGGIHAHPEGSRQAITYFAEVLGTVPRSSALYMKAIWLLNIMYMTVGAYPDQVPAQYLIPPRLFESEEPFPRFANIAPGLGLDTFGLLGSAVADDFTGDGYLDIVVSTWDPHGQMHFFRNDRDGTFSDRTGQANLTGLVGGFNMVQADYDNDGDLDIFALRGGWMRQAGRIPNSLLRNAGDGTFTDVTLDAGLGEVHYATQTGAWSDYDNDGDVDLYVGNEPLDSSRDSPGQLFRNEGDGTFVDVAREAGVLNYAYAKAVGWGDYDGDGFPDLYVSNFGSANRLYRNEGDGTFVDVAADVGVGGPERSFPTWFWDFDNDGVLDLYVGGYTWDNGSLAAVAASRLGMRVGYEGAHLYRGDGAGGFDEVAAEHNLGVLTLPMAGNFGDLDNDGYLDFYLGTGYPDYEALMPNVMYRNRRGTGFADVTSAGGFGHLQKGHGIAFADLDNDGDQDVFEQMGGFYPGDQYFNVAFENPGFANHWIGVELVGVRSNRAAIGARIRAEVVENGRRRSIYKLVNSGGSFGANPLRQTIGLGEASSIEVLEVFWPATGQRQTFRQIAADRYIRITEGEEHYTTLSLEKLDMGAPSPGG